MDKPEPLTPWLRILAVFGVLPALPRCDFGLIFDRCPRYARKATFLSSGLTIGYWCAEHAGVDDRDVHLGDLGRGR